ncbi:uracil-DNA glycosylase family protein [Sphingomonas bacterium]|uniref:uracil-DNA glycosylase family protein n=1 Tax=Sphingomonas bacterium TaxID=1895847 RepID=UPI0020C71479|nr:uracil-DNA glycosylase family protein [Sphingomonas bacterium]
MTGADHNLDRALAASTLQWWRDAGVDTLVDEEPVDWLAAPARVPVTPATPATTRPATVVPAAMPADLAGFLAWRMGPDAPEAGWPGPRIGPEGQATATIVVTDVPERDDLAAGRLLSGAAGMLFDRMLAAIGLDRAGIQLVPVATARPPAGRIGGADEAPLAQVLRHHLSLARPDRVLLLGDAASRAALGLNCVSARGSLHSVNHHGGQARVIASFTPRYLLDRPKAKSDAWRDLRLLMGMVA